MATKGPALATQYRALASVLIPTGLVVQCAAAGAQDRDHGIAVDVLLNCTRTYGAVKAQPIGFADVILRNRDGRLVSLIHIWKGTPAVHSSCRSQ